LGEFDVVGLVETWVEEKGWERLEKRMPRDFEWKCQYAERESKKGRAKGGIIMDVKKGLEEENGSGVKEERGLTEKMENCNNIQQKYERNEENNRRASKRAGRRNSGDWGGF
jgi:hypothetical protein